MIKNTRINSDELSIHNNPLTRKVNSTFSNLKFFSNPMLDFLSQLDEEKKASFVLKENIHNFMNESQRSFYRESNKKLNDGVREKLKKSTRIKKEEIKNNFGRNLKNSQSEKNFNHKNKQKNINQNSNSFSKNSTAYVSKKSTRVTFNSTSNLPNFDNLSHKKIFKLEEIKNSNESLKNYIKNFQISEKHGKNLNKSLEIPAHTKPNYFDNKKKQIHKPHASSSNSSFITDYKEPSSPRLINKPSLLQTRVHLNKFYHYFLQEEQEAETIRSRITHNKQKSLYQAKSILQENYHSVVADYIAEEKRPPSRREQQPFVYGEAKKKKKEDPRLRKEENQMNYKDRVLNFDKCSQINEKVIFKYRGYLLNKFQVRLDKKDVNFSIPKIKIKPIIPPLNVKDDKSHEKVKVILGNSVSDKSLVLDKLEGKMSLRKNILKHKLREKRKIDESEIDNFFGVGNLGKM